MEEEPKYISNRNKSLWIKFICQRYNQNKTHRKIKYEDMDNISHTNSSQKNGGLLITKTSNLSN